jgi:hypothetical protein
LLLVALFVSGAVVLLGLIVDGRKADNEVSARYVERGLLREARRQRTPLREVRCFRDKGLPRSFTCLTEGADDLNLAYAVRVLPDGSLDIRAPNGRR